MSDSEKLDRIKNMIDALFDEQNAKCAELDSKQDSETRIAYATGYGVGTSGIRILKRMIQCME